MRSPTDWFTVGTISYASSLAVSMADVKEWLQVATLFAGFILTLISIAGAVRAKRKDEEE